MLIRLQGVISRMPSSVISIIIYSVAMCGEQGILFSRVLNSVVRVSAFSKVWLAELLVILLQMINPVKLTHCHVEM